MARSIDVNRIILIGAIVSGIIFPAIIALAMLGFLGVGLWLAGMVVLVVSVGIEDVIEILACFGVACWFFAIVIAGVYLVYG